MTRTGADQELIERFLDGDARALRQVRRWIEAVVHRGRWRFEDEEGVVQEVLLRLLRALKRGRFDGRSRLSTWVHSVAKFTCVDIYRREQLRDRREGGDDPGELAVATPGDAPDSVFEIEERRDLVRYVLQALPPECLQLWDWLYRQGLSAQEVGQRLNVRGSTVRVRIHRCLKRAQALASGYLGPSAAPPPSQEETS